MHPCASPQYHALRDRSAVALIAALVVAVFAVDMTTPLGLGVPFLYLLTVLAAIGTRQSARRLLFLALLCPSLAAVKLLLRPVDGVPEFGQGNRLIFALLMWSLVGLELLRRRFEERIRARRARFSADLESLVQERTEAMHRANEELRNEVAERKAAEGTVQEYAERLQALAGRLVEVQENERAHLAAELHDRIGQNLSALNINLGLSLAMLPAEAPPALRARIRDSQALLEQTTEMVRGVMEELHPALLDQYGLASALRWYGDEYSERTGIRVETAFQECFPRLHGKLETALFRIAQEALTNVAKHAGARRVVLSLARIPSGIEFAIADDGAGMDPEREAGRPIGRGWGLSIMAERAHAAGGVLRIDSAPGNGTTVKVHIADGNWERENDHQGSDR